MWASEYNTEIGRTVTADLIKPFELNGLPDNYQLDQYTSILKVVTWYFLFVFKSNRTACKTVETLIRRRILLRLSWVCTVRLCPTKFKKNCQFSRHAVRVMFNEGMHSVFKQNDIFLSCICKSNILNLRIIQLLSKIFIDGDFCHNYLHTIYLFESL